MALSFKEPKSRAIKFDNATNWATVCILDGSCGLDFDPMAFIYEHDPYCLKIYRMCKCFRQLSSDRDITTEIIKHAASRVVKNLNVIVCSIYYTPDVRRTYIESNPIRKNRTAHHLSAHSHVLRRIIVCDLYLLTIPSSFPFSSLSGYGRIYLSRRWSLSVNTFQPALHLSRLTCRRVWPLVCLRKLHASVVKLDRNAPARTQLHGA